MNVLIPAALFAIAVVSVAPAEAAQEFSCNGPETITGKAIGPTTLSVAGFACDGAPQSDKALGDRATAASSQAARRAPMVVVNFKRPEPVVKAGDTVTVKGHFSVALDPAQQMDYVVVSDAEIVN